VKLAGWAVGVSFLQVGGGLVLAAFGMQILGWVRLPGGGACGGPVGFFLGRPWRATPHPGRMGVSFAFYCAGCCGPAALGSALLLTGGGSAGAAALMLLAYAAGMAIPFVLLAAGIAFALRSLRSAIRWAPLMTAAGGATAIVAGVLLALEPVAGLLEA
jgi:cytochrome c-type biogenesis protein